MAILLPCIGAAVGAMSGPTTSGLRHGAEAAIAIKPGAGSLQTAHYASAATLPQVISGARAAARSSLTTSQIADNTVVELEPARRLIFVRVQEKSEASALALANGLAERALLFVQESMLGAHDSIRHVGDFESGALERWELVKSAFNNRPRDLQAVQGYARFGSGKLRVACAAKPACGPAVRIYGSFHAGATYVVEGWVRSTVGRSRVTLLVGASGRDIGVSEPHRLSPAWRRLRAAWTPKADAGAAEVAFQTASADPVTFDIDGVSLFDPLVAEGVTPGRRWSRTERPSERVPPRASASLVPAVPVDVGSESPTTAALLGAGVGLLVAMGAIGLGQLARRRRDAERVPAV